MVELRKATLTDEADVTTLIVELGQAVGVSGGDVDPVSWFSALRKMIASPEWTFLIASEGGKDIGLLVLLIRPSLYYGGNTAVITELIVSDRYRGRGVGRLLVEEAKRLARSIGCLTLKVSTEVENEDAIGFYKKLGFDIDKKHVDFGMKL